MGDVALRSPGARSDARAADPAFAGFLRGRLELSLDALDRQVLDPRYGSFQTVDGLRLPRG